MPADGCFLEDLPALTNDKKNYLPRPAAINIIFFSFYGISNGFHDLNSMYHVIYPCKSRVTADCLNISGLRVRIDLDPTLQNVPLSFQKEVRYCFFF